MFTLKIDNMMGKIIKLEKKTKQKKEYYVIAREMDVSNKL